MPKGCGSGKSVSFVRVNGSSIPIVGKLPQGSHVIGKSNSFVGKSFTYDQKNNVLEQYGGISSEDLYSMGLNELNTTGQLSDGDIIDMFEF
jgi:hypothetical protein